MFLFPCQLYVLGLYLFIQRSLSINYLPCLYEIESATLTCPSLVKGDPVAWLGEHCKRSTANFESQCLRVLASETKTSRPHRDLDYSIQKRRHIKKRGMYNVHVGSVQEGPSDQSTVWNVFLC